MCLHTNARAPIVRNILKFASFPCICLYGVSISNALCGALLTRNAAVRTFLPRGTSETRRPRVNIEPSRSASDRRALEPVLLRGIGRRKFLAYARVETISLKCPALHSVPLSLRRRWTRRPIGMASDYTNSLSVSTASDFEAIR